MTERQSTRARRRTSAAPLPRGGASETAALPAGRHHREHHVTRDYSYVHRDLLTVLGVGVVVLGFIVGMSYVV